MKSFLQASLCVGLSALHLAEARYTVYVDQYHLTTLPNKAMTAGIDTVIMAFANSSLFTTSPPGNYEPFEPVSTMRARFDNGTKVMIALGGWGDTAGFSAGAASETSRTLYAKNVAAMLDSLDYDGVDIDWEYPGGNGADYKQNPNSGKTSEIESFPLLLAAIRSAIGPNKLISIAAPAKRGDMIAYTATQAPSIWASVDFVNLMTYDFMTRRDTITAHHTSVNDSLAAIDYYLDTLALPASKVSLGIAFYAKHFTVDTTFPCANGLGCKTVLLEAEDGTDTGFSGAMTFEATNYASAPTNLTKSPDGSCGAAVGYFCTTGNCCSSSGYCGSSAAHCGSNCLSDYGTCTSVSITDLFKTAMAKGVTDEEAGGEYYWDAENAVFWSWDTPALIKRKFTEIVEARGLGGVYAWSAGEDSYDWSHLAALQRGAKRLGLSGKRKVKKVGEY